MGWLVECDFRPRSEFFASLLKKCEGTNGGAVSECLKHVYRGAPWKGTLYTVWQNTYPDGTVVKYAVVYLIELVRNARRGDRGWGYKDIEASMGPNEVAFPLSWLEGICMDGHAADWADRVRAFWARSNQKREEKRLAKKARAEIYKTRVA